MICEACRSAEKYKTKKSKKISHSKCKGSSWCDCQHRVDRKNV